MIPLRLLTDFVAAITLNSPFSNWTNSIRSPVPIPNAVLTLTGIVTCPFDDKTATATRNSFYIFYPLH